MKPYIMEVSSLRFQEQKRKGRKMNMENKEIKDMESMKNSEMENASGGGLPTFPLPEEFQPACPRCGGSDIANNGFTCHCNSCGHTWRSVFG